MIEITIYNSFITFTDDCSPNQIGLYEGHKITNGHIIETFCGHILHDLIFTKKNQALINVLTPARNEFDSFLIKLFYQIHVIGFAYKCNGIDFQSPQNWVLRLQKSPNVIYWFKNKVTYIWYVLNTFNFNPHLKQIAILYQRKKGFNL